jgi:hypothetical protein
VAPCASRGIFASPKKCVVAIVSLLPEQPPWPAHPGAIRSAMFKQDDRSRCQNAFPSVKVDVE